jgi:hypothetical protein
VPHGDHVDYLVKGHLHHPHGDHCDDHGPVEIVPKAQHETAIRGTENDDERKLIDADNGM